MKMKRLNKIFGALSLLLLSPTITFAAETNENFSVGDTGLFIILATVSIVLLIIIIVLLNAIKGLSFAVIEKNKEKAKSIIPAILLFLMFLPQHLMAAETNETAIVMSSTVTYILISLNIFLFMVVLYLANMMKSFISDLRGIDEVEDLEPSFIEVLTEKLTDAKPIEEEKDILLDHDYDGIKELDNNLPPWWKYGFYFTIIFAFIYLIRFHITGEGKLMLEEYETEMLLAEEQKKAYLAKAANLVDENTVQFLTDASTLASGKDIFVQNCAACHGSGGQGGSVGPNLIDEFWIHGGSVNNIFSTIKYGVPQKGMIAWQAALTPKQMQEVTSYIMSMQGQELPNPRAPQGEKYVPAETETPAEIETPTVEENNSEAEVTAEK
jgi:cytochrome c oxidase cbb3-type subunit III